MKKIFTISFVLFLALSVNAQKNVRFTVNHFLGANAFAFNSEALNDMSETFTLNRMEYYISNIILVHDGGMETPASDIYILAKGDKTDTTTLGSFNVTTIEGIKFAVGVDAGVNNADPSSWASIHPLAPKDPSMHWGWSAGYRFVALEGKAGTGLSTEFQIHALGNKNYFKQSIPTDASIVGDDLVIAINADYSMALSSFTLSSGLIEHGEDNEAAECLRNFQTKVFTSLTGAKSIASSVDLEIENGFTISPVPSNGTVSVTIDDSRFSNGYMLLTDITGRVIMRQNAAGTNSFSIEEKGMYFLSLYGDAVKSTKKIIIQ
ncbi:T9SS type A sorting domain-containing protein [Bacteroidia bacterium]|nr:T9SS type A sorting domain-containing protein [Bacteroidia bacterium]MDB9881948.1 T9SS type A sorting domain-containing protein [Bacteroidia bacterium]